MRRIEVVYGFAMLCLGSFISLVASVALVTGPVPPSFWVAGSVILVATLLLFAVTIGLLVHGRRIESSSALSITFNEEAPDSTYEFVSLMSMVGGTIHIPPLQCPATLVRLYVTNLRDHHLRRVRVEIVDARGSTASTVYASWLKWMHDDGPGSPESVGGAEIPAKGRKFLDLATKAHDYPDVTLEYAMDHLRRSTTATGRVWVLLSATGVDAETNGQVPECRAAFYVEPTANGALAVLPAPDEPPEPDRTEPGPEPGKLADVAAISVSGSSATSLGVASAAPQKRTPNRAARRATRGH